MIGFGLPALLPLSLLAALPALIHILSRTRLRRIEFPTLRLFSSIRQDRVSLSRLKEFLLLAMRTLALLALLLALARPGIFPGTAEKPDLVLLIDDSYSMQYGSTWRRACSLAGTLTRNSPPDARIVILTASAHDVPVRPRTPAEAGRLIDTLQPSYAAARVIDALPRAIETADSLNARVAVITDFQRSSLVGDWSELRLSDLLLIDAGSDRPGNLAIVALKTDGSTILMDRPVEIVSQVVNFGTDTAFATVRYNTGETEASAHQTITIPPGQTRATTWSARFDRAGPSKLSVELSSPYDSLTADNHRYLAVEVRNELNVLLVESPSVTPNHVANALNADPDGILNLTRANRSELGRHNLREYDIVLVLDALALSPVDWSRLLFSLSGNTGLLLMAGPTTATPLGLAEFARSTGISSPSEPLRVTSIDSLHPVLAGINPAFWEAPRFPTVTRVETNSADILARFNDGTPFILESGGGRVLIWTTTPDPRFTDIFRRAVFVPLLMSSIEYLATGTNVQSAIVGDSLRFRGVQVDGSSGTAILHTPVTAVQIEPGGDNGTLTYEYYPADRPGHYRLNSVVTGELLALAAVNVNPVEGNLERISPDELPSAVQVTQDVTGTRDLTQLLLIIAASALAVELLLLLRR